MGWNDFNKFRSHGKTEVVAICDVDSNRLARAAKEMPDARAYTDWRELLSQWANNELVQGKQHILRAAVPAFERTLIEVALKHTQGRKRDAAELLGWGRNTLTRKMKELDM